MAPELKAPAELVVTLRTWPVPVLVMVIFAPLTNAPLGSLTVPTMLPVPTVVWANIIAESIAKTVIATRRPNRVVRLGELRFNMVHLFPFGTFRLQESSFRNRFAPDSVTSAGEKNHGVRSMMSIRFPCCFADRETLGSSRKTRSRRHTPQPVGRKASNPSSTMENPSTVKLAACVLNYLQELWADIANRSAMEPQQ